MRKSMPIPTENSTPEEWLAYANWLRNTENARLAKKVAFFRETGNYIAEEDFLFEVEENEKEAKYIESKYAPIVEYESILNGNIFRKGRNRKARHNGKRNTEKTKRLHKADRYHGKKLMVIKYKEDHEIKEGLSWLYRDCHCPVGDDVKYSLNSIKAKEKDYSLAFTGIGELLEDIAYLEDRIYIYEEDIKNLEYDKAFGYLTEEGEEFLEYYKKELEKLKEYKQYKEVLLRTATR